MLWCLEWSTYLNTIWLVVSSVTIFTNQAKKWSFKILAVLILQSVGFESKFLIKVDHVYRVTNGDLYSNKLCKTVLLCFHPIWMKPKDPHQQFPLDLEQLFCWRWWWWTPWFTETTLVPFFKISVWPGCGVISQFYVPLVKKYKKYTLRQAIQLSSSVHKIAKNSAGMLIYFLPCCSYLSCFLPCCSYLPRSYLLYFSPVCLWCGYMYMCACTVLNYCVL